MIKSISFILLTQFVHFNELNNLWQPGYFIICTDQTEHCLTVVNIERDRRQ